MSPREGRRGIVAGDTVGPFPPDGRVLVAANGPRRMVRWCVDVAVLLVLAAPLAVLGYGVVVTTTSDEGLAGGLGLPGGYLAAAVGYGALVGITRSVGERAAGVCRVRLRDGRRVGPVGAAGRMLLTALSWPLVVLGAVGSLLGSPGLEQAGPGARVVVVRRGT